MRLHYYLRDVRVEIIGRKSVPPDQLPPEREACGDWSPESRKRLLWLVNNCGVEWSTLLTLTYPETWPCVGRTCQVHLANLFRSLKKKFPGLLYLWVKEYQKRHAPHFHVLLTCFGHGLPDLRYRHNIHGKGRGPWGWKAEHKWLSRRWQETIKGFGSLAGISAGLRWELLDQPEGGARYISQYASKKDQKSVPDSVVFPGRWWSNSQAVRVVHGVPSVVLTLEEYLAGVEGEAVSKGGWLYGVLHGGRERAKRWEHLAATMPDRHEYCSTERGPAADPREGDVSTGRYSTHTCPTCGKARLWLN